MNILLVCAAGMSTSLLVNRMNEAAAAKGIGINIEAHPVGSIDQFGGAADVILLGPQAVSYTHLDVYKRQVECDVNMAIHPDDPPWSIFEIPRIITNEKNLDRFLSLYDDSHHGLTLCSGSLGCASFNDIPLLIRKYGKMRRIHFAHIRNVKILDDGSFEESAHYSRCGSLDMVEIMRAYIEVGFEGYIRPDHGRMIWGETGKPGYGLYDRGLGAMYLGGIIDALKDDGDL